MAISYIWREQVTASKLKRMRVILIGSEKESQLMTMIKINSQLRRESPVGKYAGVCTALPLSVAVSYSDVRIHPRGLARG